MIGADAFAIDYDEIMAKVMLVALSQETGVEYEELMYRLEINLTYVWIDLSGLFLVGIPSALVKFPQITHLNLSRNHIVDINPKIGLMSNLRYLDLSHNLILKIDPSLSKLSNLHYLDLSHNGISMYDPLMFRAMRNMRLLDLSNNFVPRKFDQPNVEVLL